MAKAVGSLAMGIEQLEILVDTSGRVEFGLEAHCEEFEIKEKGGVFSLEGSRREIGSASMLYREPLCTLVRWSTNIDVRRTHHEIFEPV